MSHSEGHGKSRRIEPLSDQTKRARNGQQQMYDRAANHFEQFRTVSNSFLRFLSEGGGGKPP
eukprot:8073129-Alexandrium_andersonii.AAC.1